jgi:transcriptional regulator with XRE-family HTH domain
MAKYYSPTPEEIRSLRARLSFTQTEMAEFLMCSTNAYCKWEQGVTKMYPVVWNAVQIVVAQAEPKEKKITVYEQRKLDKEAEEQRKAELEAKHAQKIAEREQAEMAKRDDLLPIFDEWMGKLRKRFGHVIRDFENYEKSHELEMAIHQMERLYEQYKTEVDASNNFDTYGESSLDEELKDWTL